MPDVPASAAIDLARELTPEQTHSPDDRRAVLAKLITLTGITRDGELALSILRKFAAGVHTSESNWLDPESGCFDGHIYDLTPDERDLLARLNQEETAKAEAEWEQEKAAREARDG